MTTATEQVKENGKRKVVVESFRTFDEALEALQEIGGVRQAKDEKVMISNIEKDGSRVRGYAQSPVVLTDEGHVRTWVESISMTPDKRENEDIFRFFIKREAVDERGAEILAGTKLVEHFNYGFDLDVRQRVKPSLISDAKAQGLISEELPLEEQIEKQIRQTTKALMLDDETEARALVIATRRKKGLPVPEE